MLSLLLSPSHASLALRTFVAILVAFVVVLTLGRPVIEWLRARKIGDNPDFDRADMNALMADKRGTPTMGGVLIVAAIALATLLAGNLRSPLVWLALGVGGALACLGGVDDWLKLNRHRRAAAGTGVATRQGLSGRQKLLVQFALGLAVGWAFYGFAESIDFHLPFVRREDAHWPRLPRWAFALWAAFVLTGASNSVNLTDGLDGLAAGCVAIASLVFLLVALSLGHRPLTAVLDLPYLPRASELAVVAGAVVGACLGFLWFNAHPARVFMGDTGSLALGGLLGVVALSLRQELLLAIVGAVFVAEALSVMLQVYYFKYTRIRFGEGRRIFRMSPLHHHFQKCGWSEPQVVVRFWIVAAMLALVGLSSIMLKFGGAAVR